MDVKTAAQEVETVCDYVWRRWTSQRLDPAVRDELRRRADGLPAGAAVALALDLALLRSVFVATEGLSVDQSLADADLMEAEFPGAGALFLAASVDGSAAVGAWEDLEEYGVRDSRDVRERTFRERWLSEAPDHDDWSSYNATAVAALTSPQCYGIVQGLDPAQPVAAFWLDGTGADGILLPDPDWRMSE